MLIITYGYGSPNLKLLKNLQNNLRHILITITDCLISISLRITCKFKICPFWGVNLR